MILKKINKYIRRYFSSRLKKLLFSGQDLEILSKYKQNSCFPPGHYYSPIVDVDTLIKREKTIWPDDAQPPLEIGLNEVRQLELLNEFRRYYQEFPYTNNLNQELRYNLINTYFDPLDAFTIYSFIRHFSPGKILEVGSGYSSAIMLDTNEHFNKNTILLTFIEPFPERLKKLLHRGDQEGCDIIEKELQDVPLEIFKSLSNNDILFIDSTHVCKTGSDLNYLFFKVLPALHPGVIVHFHDIFCSFEYPRQWVLGGRNWNENYILKAFLMYNNIFQILFFNDYLFNYYHKELVDVFPYPNLTTGGSIYLIKK